MELRSLGFLRLRCCSRRLSIEPADSYERTMRQSETALALRWAHACVEMNIPYSMREARRKRAKNNDGRGACQPDINAKRRVSTSSARPLRNHPYYGLHSPDKRNHRVMTGMACQVGSLRASHLPPQRRCTRTPDTCRNSPGSHSGSFRSI